MKTRLLSSLAAVFATLALTTAASAQYKPVGDDGIAASPKLRQLLSSKPSTNKPALTMACSKCTELRSTELRPEAKGAEALSQATQVKYSHRCSACRTKLSPTGEGKAKHQVATHTCSMNSPNVPSCCDSK